MTTVKTADRTILNANGLTPLPFDDFQAISDVEVGVLRNGVEQLGGFDVELNGDGTGTVTPLDDWGTDEVTIFSKPSFEQPANFSRFGDFYPDQFVPPLDRLARTAIALKDQKVSKPFGDVAGLFLAFDGDGNPVGASGTGVDETLRTDLASAAGSLLVKHKSADANTYGRSMRQWAAVGGLGSENVFNWIDPDLDASILDGTIADDLVEMIMAAINQKSANGGGVVRFPAGLFLVGAYSGGGVITVPNDVRLTGCGSASIIKLKTGTNRNLVNLAANCENVEVDHLLLDGNCNNDVNNSAGTTFRSDGPLQAWLHHLRIRDSAAYGMGFEAGSARYLTIDHIDIDGCMADGIDFKNIGDGNNQITISHVMIRNYALNPEEATQTGMDIRGAAQLSHIWIESPGKSDAVGIRFRQGEVGETNGLGAHNSSLTNFSIKMSGGANQWGINAVARGIAVANGNIFNARRGVYVQDSGFIGSNIKVFSASEYGFYLRATDGTLDADDSSLAQCSSYGSDTGFMVEADRCQLNGCYADSSTTADVNIAATANQTTVNGGDFRSATKFILNGTNFRIENAQRFEESFTVAELGTKLLAPPTGRRTLVTDANATLTAGIGAVVAGGGANTVPVVYDGANWRIG
jgi:hypothetical protein